MYRVANLLLMVQQCLGLLEGRQRQLKGYQDGEVTGLSIRLAERQDFGRSIIVEWAVEVDSCALDVFPFFRTMGRKRFYQMSV